MAKGARGLKTAIRHQPHQAHHAHQAVATLSASNPGGLGGMIPPRKSFPSLFPTPLFSPSLFLLLFFAFLLLPNFAHAAPEKVNVGFRTALAWSAEQNRHIDLAVWYPCNRGPSTITIGDYSFEAARNAAPLPGKFPLLVLAHDSTGSRFSHRDLAITLAKRGFVVAVPTMADDNDMDMRLLFSSRQWAERSRQLFAVVDELLQNTTLSAMIDTQRVGIFGFGNGGSAALMQAGARPLATGWAGFCRKNPQDMYCTGYLGERMGRMARAMVEDQRDLIRAREEYAQVEMERQAILQKAALAHKQAVEKAQRQKKPEPEYIEPELPALPEIPQVLDMEAIDFRDERVKAIGIFSPGMAFFWDPETLKKLTVPLLFIGTEQDILNKPQAHAEYLAMQSPTAAYLLYTKGSVLDMQSACPPSFAGILPELCQSVDEGTRQKLIEKLADDMTAFFMQAFM